MSKVTMQEMFQAGIHFGHYKRYWNPKMAPYIFGIRHGIHIINLEKSLPLFEEAINFAGKIISENGTILFVGTKRAASAIVKEQAERCGMPYVAHRWPGGMLTNFKTIKQSIKTLKDIVASQENGSINKLTKKEILMKLRTKEKLEKSLGGIQDMRKMPDAIFVVDVNHEQIAVKEAQKITIPTIGIVDTNSNPENIDYVVPGNDDSIRSITLFCTSMADSVLYAKSLIKAPPTEEEQVVSRTGAKVTLVEKKHTPTADAKTPARKKAPKKAETTAETNKQKVDEAVVDSAESVETTKTKKTASTTKESKTTKSSAKSKPSAKKTASKAPKAVKATEDKPSKKSEEEKKSSTPEDTKSTAEKSKDA